MTYEFRFLAFALFAVITLTTLVISFWASRKVKTAGHFYVAGGKVRWFMNGIAFAGDYLSAASFLGIAGMVAFSGYDGFMYAIGFLAGWIVALFLIAEPLRNIGKYTFGDALAYKFPSRKVRLMSSVGALVISIFYLIPQMVGAGSIIQPLIGISYEVGVVIVGIVVIIITATAGMVSTTWVQFIKGFLLLVAALAMTVAILMVAGMGPIEFITHFIKNPEILLPTGKTISGEQFMAPGMKFKDPLDFASLALALILGTAALPHILIRYYTVPKPSDARKSTVIAIVAIGLFYLMTLYLGLGSNFFRAYDPANQNLSAPLLAEFIGGEFFFAFISSVAFATILGTVAGLIMASAGAVAHDIYTEFMGRRGNEKKTLLVSKVTSVVVGLLTIAIGILMKGQNVAFLVGLAFAVAASCNLPALVCTLFWKKTTDVGVYSGMAVGLISSIILIFLSPTFMGESAIFPLNNPGIVSIPLGFVVLVAVSLATRPAPSSTEVDATPA
ncbi:MAG: cation acetate symporter [Ignavibacteria bacterium]|nr:cation acetate symporter [Ignavibacteria bacterium]